MVLNQQAVLQPPPNSPHLGHLKMSGNIFYYHNLGVLLVGRGYEYAKHPTMHRIAHYNK